MSNDDRPDVYPMTTKPISLEEMRANRRSWLEVFARMVANPLFPNSEHSAQRPNEKTPVHPAPQIKPDSSEF